MLRLHGLKVDQVAEYLRQSLEMHQVHGNTNPLKELHASLPVSLKKQLDEQLRPFISQKQNDVGLLTPFNEFKFTSLNRQWDGGVPLKSRLLRLYADLGKKGALPEDLALALVFSAFVDSAVFKGVPRKRSLPKSNSVRAWQGGGTGLKR